MRNIITIIMSLLGAVFFVIGFAGMGSAIVAVSGLSVIGITMLVYSASEEDVEEDYDSMCEVEYDEYEEYDEERVAAYIAVFDMHEVRPKGRGVA